MQQDTLSDAELDALCIRWAVWCNMHRLLAPPVPKGILARMQPGKVRAAPNIALSAELSRFNTAVSAQPDTPAKTSFVIFYCYPARSVKEAAAAMHISRDAFYKRVRRFRRAAYRAAATLEHAARVQNGIYSAQRNEGQRARGTVAGLGAEAR